MALSRLLAEVLVDERRLLTELLHAVDALLFFRHLPQSTPPKETSSIFGSNFIIVGFNVLIVMLSRSISFNIATSRTVNNNCNLNIVISILWYKHLHYNS